MNKATNPYIIPQIEDSEPTLWFIFHNEKILLQTSFEKFKVPEKLNSIFNSSITQQLYIGKLENIHCFAAHINNLSSVALAEGMEFVHIRQSFFALDDENIFLIASKALEILYWDRRTKFCGCCGEITKHSDIEGAKICLSCKSTFFPQISPAILALVWRKNEILLARSPNFTSGIYSILAGFMEPGETIEQTIIREVKEEVNINIKNLNYVSSQAWPFPSNIMIGFTVEYDSGEIAIDKLELEDAKWFSIENLPTLPNQMSLSRRMIDAHVKKLQKN